MAWTKRFSRAAWAAPSCDGVNPPPAFNVAAGHIEASIIRIAISAAELTRDHVVCFARTRSRPRAAAIGATLSPERVPAKVWNPDVADPQHGYQATDFVQ